MRKVHPSFVLAMLVAATLAACGGDGGDSGGGGDDEVAAGQEVFEANCASCHGIAAVGTHSGPPLVHEYYEPSHHGDDAFRSAIANGVSPHHWEFGPMPPVEGLDDEDVEAVIAYVRSLQREAGIE